MAPLKCIFHYDVFQSNVVKCHRSPSYILQIYLRFYWNIDAVYTSLMDKYQITENRTIWVIPIRWPINLVMCFCHSLFSLLTWRLSLFSPHLQPFSSHLFSDRHVLLSPAIPSCPTLPRSMNQGCPHAFKCPWWCLWISKRDDQMACVRHGLANVDQRVLIWIGTTQHFIVREIKWSHFNMDLRWRC